MTSTERDAILTIALMAAFADGNNSTSERDQIRRITDALGAESGVNVAAIVQSVLLKQVTLEAAAGQIGSSELRQLAYEFAVGVCDADGATSPAEAAFLQSLGAALKLDGAAASAIGATAVALANAPLAASVSPSTGATIEPPLASTMSAAETDKMILNYAILNGALELLPQSLASMAIIPLQMKMVYRIGKAHGFELDKGHIKDFLATLGVGLTSQYVEQFGRRLVGGLLGKLAGGIGRGVGSAATGAAFSFGTTYALGHVAKRYYAGGRTLSGEMLKQGFADMVGEAKQLQSRYLPQIQEKARTIDVTQVMKEVAR